MRIDMPVGGPQSSFTVQPAMYSKVYVVFGTWTPRNLAPSSTAAVLLRLFRKLSQQPLGQWLLPATQLRRDWPYYFDQSNATLNVWSEPPLFVQYRSTDGVSFSDGSPCEWSPSATSVPVETKILLDVSPWYSLTLAFSQVKSFTLPSQSTSFLDYLHHLPPSDRLLFESLELLQDIASGQRLWLKWKATLSPKMESISQKCRWYLDLLNTLDSIWKHVCMKDSIELQPLASQTGHYEGI
jgi:hypothetical protein